MTPVAAVALLTAALATAFAWRRTAWFSPATLWSLMCLGNVATLYGVILAEVHLPSLLISPMPSIRLGDHFAETAAFFAVMSLIGPFAVLGLAPRSGAADAGGAAARESLAATLARLRESRWTTLYAVGAAAVAAGHFALIDKEALLVTSEYLALADVRRNGLEGGLGGFLNNGMRPLAMPAFLLLALRREGRPDLAGVLLALVAAYAFVFCLAIYSRFLMVYVFVFLLGRMLSRRRMGLGGALGVAALGALVLLAFAVAMTGRGHQAQGLASVGAVLARLDVGALEYLGLKLVATSFDGALSYANALRLGPDYAPAYQALSFSPLPSALDGFAELRLREAHRINVFVPVSAFGEARHFHPALTLAFLAICALVTRQATLGFFRHRDLVTIALYPAFLICLLKFQAYSMRTSLRLFVAVAVISWVACRLRAARAREGPAQGRPPRGAPAPA